MFSPSQIVIDHFVQNLADTYAKAFPQADPAKVCLLEQSARMALEAINNSDCPYHDMNHTVLVTDCGQTILWGRLMSQGDLSGDDWLNALLALLHHDIGFVRGLLRGDRDGTYVVNEFGDTVTPPVGATDAYLSPYHVTRGCLFVRERFGQESLVDADAVCAHIEMTRFPVPPESHYQQTASIGGLVRAADLIGQMADPHYIQKLPKLFTEFRESGESERLGYENPADLRSKYPNFFFSQVRPYISEGLRFLRRTQHGQAWVANLFHHIYSEQQFEPGYGPERRERPEDNPVFRRRASDRMPPQLAANNP